MDTIVSYIQLVNSTTGENYILRIKQRKKDRKTMELCVQNLEDKLKSPVYMHMSGRGQRKWAETF